jgi:hypothetical protein
LLRRMARQSLNLAVCSKTDSTKVRSSCQLVGGQLLIARSTIRRVALVVLIVSLGASISIAQVSADNRGAKASHALSAAPQHDLVQIKQKIARFRNTTWHWQSLMGQRHTRGSQSAISTKSIAYAKWSLRLWQQRSKSLHVAAKHWMSRHTAKYIADVDYMRRVMGRPPARWLANAGSIEVQFNQSRRVAQEALAQFQNPPEMSAFACIHRYEGSWTDRDSGHNGHFGGVQFGKNEWLRYGYPYTGKKWAYEATRLEQYWAAYRYWQVSGFSPWPHTAHLCGLL